MALRWITKEQEIEQNIERIAFQEARTELAAWKALAQVQHSIMTTQRTLIDEKNKMIERMLVTLHEGGDTMQTLLIALMLCAAEQERTKANEPQQQQPTG